MKDIRRTGQTAPGARNRSRPFRLSRLAVALAASSLFAAGPVHANIISDTGPPNNEPTNDLLTGATAGGVGDEFRGCVGRDISFCGPNDPHANGNDPADFVSFGGLAFGSNYNVSLTEVPSDFGSVSLVFDLFANGSTTPFASYTLGPDPPGRSILVSLPTGFSSLAVGVQTLAHAGDPSVNNIAEGYRVSLTQANASVPEPATAALLAAGIVGAFVTRRRKRS